MSGAGGELTGQTGTSGTNGSGGNGAGGDQSTGASGAGTQGSSGGGQISYPSNWKDGLPDDIKGDAALGVIHDIPSLAKSYIHAQKAIGKDKLVVPNEFSSKEDWENVYNKLGRPSSHKEYQVKLEKPEDWDKDALDAFYSEAHVAGLLPKQVEKILNYFSKQNEKSQLEAQTKHTQEVDQGITKLKQEWGEAYNKKLGFAKTVVQEVGGNEFVQFLNDTGLSSNHHMIKLLAKVGEMFAEDDIVVTGASSSNRGSMTPEQLDAKIAELKAHPAYYDGKHQQHLHIKNEVNSLYDRRFPKEQA